MVEPNSTTAGVLIGTGIGLTGTIMGAQVDALIVGLIAAILISIWLPAIDDRLKAAASVSLSAVLAGYGSPVAVGWIAAQPQGISASDPLRLLLAAVIGIAVPSLLPKVLGKLGAKVEGA